MPAGVTPYPLDASPLAPSAAGMVRPHPRGALSQALLTTLQQRRAGTDPTALHEIVRRAGAPGPALLQDPDALLTLLCLHGLPRRGVVGVDPAWESDPVLLGVGGTLQERLVGVGGTLQERLVGELRALAVAPATARASGTDTVRALLDVVLAGPGPELRDWLAGDRSHATLRELLVHQSVARLRVPQVVLGLLPRLGGGPEPLVDALLRAGGDVRTARDDVAGAALVLRSAGLSDRDGFYLDVLPAPTLAGLAALESFASRRAHVGATVGLLAAGAAAEVSVGVSGSYLRGLGFDADVADRFEGHAHTATLDALLDLVCLVVDHGIASGEDVLLGACAAEHARRATHSHMLAAWDRGESSLRPCPSRPELASLGVRHVP